MIIPVVGYPKEKAPALRPKITDALSDILTQRYLHTNSLQPLQP